jgi:myo-inositol 2-dehydrogenase / D-chiro-inositol 1-dehydrogenase
MRVAVIGAGSMGGGHARLLATVPEVDEVLVVDAVASRATALAEEIGGRALAHDAALDAADAVVVATPADLHAMTVDSAVSRSLPVLCEKPLTGDLRSTTELVRRVEEAGAHVEVGFQRRHDPTYLTAHAQIVDGSAGRLHLLRLTAHDPQTTPRIPNRWLPNDAAPLFLHSWIHDFDFVRWLSGQEVVEVTVDGSRHDDPRPDNPGDIETAVIVMRLSGGTLAILEATWLHPTGYDSRVELVADRVHLAMGVTDRTPATWLDGRAAAANEPWQGYLERFEAAYRAELEAFLAGCRGERAPATSARDGLEAMRIAVAATRAYQQRRTVSLDEIPDLPRRVTA